MNGDVDTFELRRAVPRSVIEICERLEQHGHAAWVVGGCVRDHLMQTLFPGAAPRPPGDWDIATSAHPETVVKLFPKVIPTGLEHGTVTVLVSKVPYEVTTFRAEAGYVDGRRPGQVVFLNDITADLSRRDFTVNAIAFDPLSGELADPYAGIDDLRARVLRAVGNPAERFAEDGLRVLRAARFVSTLEFTLDPATAAAMEPSLDSYRKVSAERIRDEWFKALKTRRPSLAFDVMAQHGLLSITVPELDEVSRAHGWASVLKWVDACPPRAPLRLAALFAGLAPMTGEGPYQTCEVGAVDTLLQRLRLSNQERALVVGLLKFHPLLNSGAAPAEIRRWLRALGATPVSELFTLALCNPNLTLDLRTDVAALHERVFGVIGENPALSVKDLAIDGKTLMRELGLSPGKHLGELLQQLLEVVTDEPSLNSRDGLLRCARELVGV